MRHNPTPGCSPGAAEDSLDEALLGLLVHDHPGLWSLVELDRSLTPSSGHDPAGDARPGPDTEDAVARLYAAGLIHRIGNFVFATRAAHVADHVNS